MGQSLPSPPRTRTRTHTRAHTRRNSAARTVIGPQPGETRRSPASRVGFRPREGCYVKKLSGSRIFAAGVLGKRALP